MLASFSIVPLGVGEKLGKYIAEIVDIVDRSGLPYKLGAMQTTVEGGEEEVLSLIMECHRQMLKKAKRVLTHITIDDRRGAKRRLEGKPVDIEAKLGRKLRKE